IAAQGLVALAPLVGGRSRARDRALKDAVLAAAIALVAAWLLLRAHSGRLPALTSLPGAGETPPGLVSALAVQALFDLLAVVGWGRRLAKTGGDLAMGLAQYLFAVSTNAQMLAAGTPVEEVGPQLKQAAALAQQEARFAVLALSSASGTSTFDSALRRYVEFLTADGELEVDLEIDPAIRLAPDEQIEIFRIVQEGLGNVRKHSHATRARVRIGDRLGQRYVSVVDNGRGFDGETRPAGQGLKNIRKRAESIEG